MSQSEPKIVGNCPTCGAPIYAQSPAGKGVPRSVYSCDCRLQAKKTQSNAGKMTKYGAVSPTRH